MIFFFQNQTVISTKSQIPKTNKIKKTKKKRLSHLELLLPPLPPIPSLNFNDGVIIARMVVFPEGFSGDCQTETSTLPL